MKPVIAFSVFLIAFAFLNPAASAQESSAVSLDAEVSWANNYTWRGLRITDGEVLQPSATLGFAGFSFNFWGNMDLTDLNDAQYKFNEIDLTGSYSRELEMVTVEIGLIYYTFPNTDYDSTFEIFGGLSFNLPLNPSVTVFQDFDLVEGTYVSAGVSQNFLEDAYSQYISVFATLGWATAEHNAFYYGADVSGFTDFQAGTSAVIAINDGLYIIPSITWTTFASSDIRDLFEETSHFTNTITASFTF